MGIVSGAFAMASGRTAHAQPAPVQTLWNRLTLDVGYEVSFVRGLTTPSYYSQNAATGREVSALLFLRYRSVSHGIGVDAAFSLRPWMGVGVDGHLQQDFTALAHPWFDTLGIRYGRRKALTLGLFVEFRPSQRDYLPRRGIFLRAGAREIWFDRELTRADDVVKPSNGRGQDVQGWLGGGYRVIVTSVVSLHIMAEAAGGIDTFEGRLRLGGGFQ